MININYILNTFFLFFSFSFFFIHIYMYLRINTDFYIRILIYPYLHILRSLQGYTPIHAHTLMHGEANLCVRKIVFAVR